MIIRMKVSEMQQQATLQQQQTGAALAAQWQQEAAHIFPQYGEYQARAIDRQEGQIWNFDSKKEVCLKFPRHTRLSF